MSMAEGVGFEFTDPEVALQGAEADELAVEP